MSVPTQEVSSPDLVSQAVQIGDGVWWVGRRTPKQIFYANPYLIHLTGNDATFNMVIDPGSQGEFSVIGSKIRQVLPSLEDLHAVYINHQDPDVASSVGMILQRYSPNAQVFCSEDTWRLIQYYNVPRERFLPLERFEHGIKTAVGRTLVPVPSPFCHFVGAVMLYDQHNQILFTGDLFGSLTSKDAEGLWADDSDWVGMRAFHQLYMPTNKALKIAISRIRALLPRVRIIAPQHGRLIRGEYVGEFMSRLEHLEVGLDILEEKGKTADERRAWIAVFDRTLGVAKEFLGENIEVTLLDDPVIRNHLEFDGRRLVMNSETPKRALEKAVMVMSDNASSDVAQAIKYEAVMAAHEMDLPTPSLELDEGA